MICDNSLYADGGTVGERKIELLRRLLDVVVMESADVADGNIEKLGEYSLVKKELMAGIDGLDDSDVASIGVEHGGEIKCLIAEIQDINGRNEMALVALREKIKGEMAALHTKKKTHNAYFANEMEGLKD